MIDSLFSIQNVGIGYQTSICENISANVQKGDFIGLIGKNGSGKSTLIKTILGLQSPKMGHIYMNGEEISNWNAQQRAKNMAVVFSQMKSVPAISVLEMVYLGKLPHKNWMLSPNPNEIQQIDEILDLIGISHLRNKTANQLSDGQLQMVMIARALLQETDLIVMDEPTSHLDLENQFRIFEIIYKLTQQTSKTFIIATHQVELISQKATQLWWMNKGEFQAGFPEDIALKTDFLSEFEQDKIQFDYRLGKYIFKQNQTKFVSFRKDESKLAYWVNQALQRNGFGIEANSKQQIQVENSTISLNQQKMDSIEQLIQTLNQKQ